MTSLNQFSIENSSNQLSETITDSANEMKSVHPQPTYCMRGQLYITLFTNNKSTQVRRKKKGISYKIWHK